MPKETKPGRPTARRYSDKEKAQAVRLVRQLRRELGTEHGTIQRVADQLRYGVETVRKWVKRAHIDEGLKVGTSSEDRARIKALEQQNRELRRANAILKSASAFFPAELDRPSKSSSTTRRPPRGVRSRAHLQGPADGSEHLLRRQAPLARAVGAGAAGRGDDAGPGGAVGGQP